MSLRRFIAALSVPAAIAAAVCADARPNQPPPPTQGPAQPAMRPDPNPPEPLEWRDPYAIRTGMARAWDMGQGVELGIGRYAVPQIARPATNLERFRAPLDVRSRDSSIGGVGVSLRF